MQFRRTLKSSERNLLYGIAMLLTGLLAPSIGVQAGQLHLSTSTVDLIGFFLVGGSYLFGVLAVSTFCPLLLVHHLVVRARLEEGKRLASDFRYEMIKSEIKQEDIE